MALSVNKKRYSLSFYQLNILDNAIGFNLNYLLEKTTLADSAWQK